MATVIAARATFFTMIMFFSALTIEKSKGTPSRLQQSSSVKSAILGQAEAAKNSKSLGAASSEDIPSIINVSEHTEQEPGEASDSRKETPCLVCGKKVSAESMVGLEEVAVVKRVRLLADLLTKKLQLQPTDSNESSDLDTVSHAGSTLADLPKALLDTGHDEEDKEDVDVWDKIKIFTGEKATEQCGNMRSAKCYDFRFREEFKTAVVAAHLWLHRSICGNDVTKHSVLVSQIDRTHFRSGIPTLLKRTSMLLNQDWLKVNITQAVVSWAEENKDSVSLAFSCVPKIGRSVTEKKSKHTPLLAVEFARERRIRRVKRSEGAEEECNRITQCCRVNLTITPSQLGLDQVLSSVTTNYCFGVCIPMESYPTNHSLFRTEWIEHSDMLHASNQLRSCCVPTKLGPGNITVREGGEAVVKTLSNLVALECGCV